MNNINIVFVVGRLFCRGGVSAAGVAPSNQFDFCL
jgi:hypothetical protein